MAAIVMENTGDLGAAKFHIYARPQDTALADYTETTVNAALAASSYFAKVDAEFEQTTTKGEVITMADGSKLVTTSEVAGAIKVYGLSSVDYKALMDTGTGYNLKDTDIFILQAPTSQAEGTAEIGQSLFQVYAVNAYVTLDLVSGVPVSVSIAWERTDSSSEVGTEWDIVVADV